MVPRSQRSIFHLGEEGGDADLHLHRGAGKNTEHSNTSSARHHGGRRRQRRGERDAGGGAGADAVVGLQILVHHRHHDARGAAAAAARSHHIVMKQMVLPPAAAARHRRGHELCSFLRACSHCRSELSPDKDVYMYRGDQGFCSEECRWRRILQDEAREREAMIRNDRRGLPPPHHHRHGTRSTAAAAIRGAPRRLLAVA
ncbi:hypothetical protein ACP4OV_023634 [Aristida adscensionis]